MARAPPAGVVSASWRPIVLSGMWRSRQRKGLVFNHMRDLIAVLSTVAPGVLEDPHFLGRCLLLDGVPVSVTPRDLSQSILGVQEAVLVRDTQSGLRIGLIVFSDPLESAAVLRQHQREGLYATCTPANQPGEEVSRTYILDGIGDELARRCVASLFRSLLPPQYLLDDEDREFHLRCLLIGASRAMISDGPHGLCDLAWKVLCVRGFVVAAIVHRDRQAGILVYDDAECTELVARRAPHLLHKTGLELLDSSLFPSLAVADPAGREASLLRLLLPQCITSDEESYRRRVLLLTGLEQVSQKLDAAVFAHFLHSEADLMHPVEAVMIHRPEGLIAVVLGSLEDEVSLLQTPEDTWLRLFGQIPGFASFSGFTGPESVSLISSDVFSGSQQWGARYWRGTPAFQRVRDWMSDKERRLRDDDTIGIVHCLIRVCTLESPDSVLRDGFPERSLLLSGVVQGTTCSDLSATLSDFGDLYDVALDISGLALAVFRFWHGAARLSREPRDRWPGLGFFECSRVPDAQYAGVIAQEVVDRFLMEEAQGPVLQ